MPGTATPGRTYTNQQLTDVGSGKATDRSPLIDVPQLSNIALTAPYLHDGSARTLEEIWTIFNPNDTHGVTNDLQKDELNDLIEYLKTSMRKTILGLFCSAISLLAARPLRRTCRATAGRTSPPPTACRTTTCFKSCVDGNRIWAATENGLGLYENGKWKVYRTADGLAHRAVLYVAADKRTGDVWVATMGGLSRFSAGRFDDITRSSTAGCPTTWCTVWRSRAISCGSPPPRAPVA